MAPPVFFHLQFRPKDGIHLEHAVREREDRDQRIDGKQCLLKVFETWHASYPFVFYEAKQIAWSNLMLVEWRGISLNHVILLVYEGKKELSNVNFI